MTDAVNGSKNVSFLHNLGIRAWGLFAKVVFILFGGLRVSGSENVPQSGAFLLASNHTSLSDPVGLLVTCPRIMHYMAAAELFDIPVIGRLIKFLQAFPVHRGQNDVKALAIGRELLRQGQGVVVYPEGKISVDGYLKEFHDGVVLLALRAKCPIVPVVMLGFNKMLPPDGKFLHFARKEVRYGRPLYFNFSSDIKLKQQVQLASQQLREAMLALGAPQNPQEVGHHSDEALR